MRGIKIPLQYFALKMQGGPVHEGGAYLRDATVSTVCMYTRAIKQLCKRLKAESGRDPPLIHG